MVWVNTDSAREGFQQGFEQRAGVVSQLDAVMKKLPGDSGVCEPFARKAGGAMPDGVKVFGCGAFPLRGDPRVHSGLLEVGARLIEFGGDECGWSSGPECGCPRRGGPVSFDDLKIDMELVGFVGDRLPRRSRGLQLACCAGRGASDDRVVQGGETVGDLRDAVGGELDRVVGGRACVPELGDAAQDLPDGVGDVPVAGVSGLVEQLESSVDGFDLAGEGCNGVGGLANLQFLGLEQAGETKEVDALGGFVVQELTHPGEVD
ncbi:hypothetical protein [Actinoallomurus acanthiterrae]